MDIKKLKAADTAKIHIKDGNGEFLYDGDKPVTITIYGPGSKQFGVVESRQSARAIKRMQDNDGKITAAPHEDRLRETAEDLAAITIAMEGLEDGDKQGQDLFEAIYSDPQLGYIARQVSKAVADWSNFTPRSAAS